MQSTTNKTKTFMQSKRDAKPQKRFMDYAVIIDFLFSAALLVFFCIKIRSFSQMGFDAAIESDFGVATGSEALDILLLFGTPVLGFLASLSFIIEAIYFSIKLRGKQPFITEKYAIVFMVSKIITIIFLIGGILIL